MPTRISSKPVKKIPAKNPELTFKPSINKTYNGSTNLKSNSSKGLNNIENESSINNFKDFLNRQKLHELNKRQKLHYIANLKNRSSSPEINQRSREIAEKLGNFTSRMNHKSPCKAIVDRINEEMNTFRPILYNNPRHIKKPITCARPKKEVKTKSIPKSKEYSNTKSKLQIIKGIDSLLKRIKEENEMKQELYDKKNYIKRAEEEFECTHKPNKSPLPEYFNNKRRKSPEEKQKIYKYSK